MYGFEMDIRDEDRIRELIEENINPMLAMHGGSMELVGTSEYDVYIEFSGGCQGCAGARITLHNYIASAIKNEIPYVENVIDVTDHQSGTNPYYKEGELDEDDN